MGVECTPPEATGNLPSLRQHVDFGSMSRQNLKDLLDLVDRLGLRLKCRFQTENRWKQQKQRGKGIRKMHRNNVCIWSWKESLQGNWGSIFFLMNLSALKMPQALFVFFNVLKLPKPMVEFCCQAALEKIYKSNLRTFPFRKMSEVETLFHTGKKTQGRHGNSAGALFGMVKPWPFGNVKWPPTGRGWKGHIAPIGKACFSVPPFFRGFRC